MPTISQAMLMAAGLGTRMRPFSDHFSKPHLPIFGIPVVVYSLDQCAAAGIRRLVANVHHLPEKTREHWNLIQNEYAPKAPHSWPVIEQSDESTQLLGSAGGIRKALLKFGNKPFFVINGDSLCDLDFAALSKRHTYLRNKYGVTLTLALHRNEGEFLQPGKYRELACDSARERVLEAGEVVSGRPFLSGIYVAEPEAFSGLPADQPADFLEQVLKPAIAQGKVGAHYISGHWFDAGSPALWLQTHMDLIDALEVGNCPLGWRKRIVDENARIGDRLWLSHRADQNSPAHLRAMQWIAPCYVDALAKRGELPGAIGPHAVIYGDFPKTVGALENGIAYARHWVSAAKT